MNYKDKIIEFNRLGDFKRFHAFKNGNQFPRILTNGCFRIVTAAHIHYLQEAQNLGGYLMVGVNSDNSIVQLGKKQVVPEDDRAAIVASLFFVDYVTIFPGPDALELISVCKPDIYVKGGDYTLDTINQDERKLLEEMGCEIKILNKVDGLSSSSILSQLG